MRKTIHTLMFVQLLDALGLGLLLPILPFWVQAYGATAVEVTQLVALYAFMSMVFSPLAGKLSDRMQRKPVVVLATLGSTFSYAGFIFADSLISIFLMRALTGLMSAKGGVVSAWLLDAVPEEERGRYIGLLGSMNGIGMLIGPILASGLLFIGGDAGYTLVFAFTAGLSLMAAMVLIFVSNVAEASAGEAAVYKAQPQIDLLLLNFGIFLGFSVVFSVSAIYMQQVFGWDASRAGFAIGAMTGCVAFSRIWLAHRLLKYCGDGKATILTMFVMGLCLFGCVATGRTEIFMFLYCIGAMSYAVAAIGVAVLLAARVDAVHRGHAMGQLSASGSAAIVIGATTHGYLFSYFGPAAPFQIYGSLLVLVVIGWLFFKTKRLSGGYT